MKAGRFRDALLELRKLEGHFEPRNRESCCVLMAEALQLTGDIQAAESLAIETSKTRGIKPSTLAQCHIVLASICRDRGQLREAVAHLERACRFAEAAQSAALQCWTSLRLMMVTGEMDGAEAAIAMLPEIRRRVTNLADPIVLAALHLWVAEFESKRGLLATADKHIQMGRAILRRHNNVWLEGSAAIDDCCLAYLRSDVTAAFAFASEALDLSTHSGHAATRMAACTNLAHLQMASGDFAEAERLFRDALASWHGGGANEVAILDGLAQLELAQNNFHKCEQYLHEISRIEIGRATKPGYYQSWSFRTQLQLLIAQSRTAEAHAFMASIQHNLEKFHPVLRLALSGLHAELLLTTNNIRAAETLLSQAYVSSDGQSPEVLAQLEVTLGKALARRGHGLLAEWHLERANRIFRHLHQTTASAIAVTELKQVKSSSARAPLQAHAEVRADVLGQIKSLLDFRGNPGLLSQEALQLFRQLDCAQQLSVVTTESNDRQPNMKGPDCNLAVHIEDPNVIRVRLGSTGRNELSLIAVPKNDLASKVACVHVCRILDAVVAVQSMGRRLEEHAEPWPVSDVQSKDPVFVSTLMQDILAVIRKIAPSNVTVLITGETGTGKEILARELHALSERRDRVFAPFNCAAVPRDLAESQLFGHRRGAFSGAQENFDGIIRAAEGGTLFLDEIGELSTDIQPKLLRFLESGEVQPLGEVRIAKVNVRVIAASNSNLEDGVNRGTFREDLFYRLNVIRFRIPPLRERREEILPLAKYFLRKYSEEYLKRGVSLADQTAECLLFYRWPGNVRQLANELRRLVALADEQSVIYPRQLSPEILSDNKHSNVDHTGHDEIRVSLNQPIEAAVEHLAGC